MADLDLITRKPMKRYDRRSITSAENGRRAWGKHLETQIVSLANSTKDERLKFDALKYLYDRHANRTTFYRDHVLYWSKDLSRTIDYIQTRTDLDGSKLVYYGLSWGAALSPIMVAVEDRIKVAAITGGGLEFQQTLPEVDPVNFAPRVKVPFIIVNGRYDFFFPPETSQKPLFRLLGTPEKDKRLVISETGHVPPPDLLMREIVDWLDRYLGPVQH